MPPLELGAFCNTFDLHEVIIGLENQFLVFLRVAVLDRFYCILMGKSMIPKENLALWKTKKVWVVVMISLYTIRRVAKGETRKHVLQHHMGLHVKNPDFVPCE